MGYDRFIAADIRENDVSLTLAVPCLHPVKIIAGRVGFASERPIRTEVEIAAIRVVELLEVVQYGAVGGHQ